MYSVVCSLVHVSIHTDRAGDVISFSGLPVDADAEAGEVAEQGLTSPFVFVLAYQGAEMGDSKAKEEGESSSRCS